MPDVPSVLLVAQPEDGGVAEHVAWLAEGLVARDWRVVLAAPAASTIVPRLARVGVDVRTVPMARAPGREDIGARAALRRIAAEVRPDLVHAHSSKAGALARLWATTAPVVYTPHCFAFATEMPAARRTLYRAVEQALVPRTAAIIAVCEWERRVALAGLRGVARRVRVVRNGVPGCAEALPDPAMLEFAAGRPLAGYVSRLAEPKDPVVLVGAAVDAAVAGSPLALAIVGDGPYAADVDAEIERLGAGDRIRRFPFSGSMAPHLRALDVFLFASRWEAFPLAVLEAMACGLPVVAPALGGIPEAVQDGVTGLLVGAGARPAFADALVALSDERRRAEMSAAAAAAARVHFTVGRMVDETVAVYASVQPDGPPVLRPA